MYFFLMQFACFGMAKPKHVDSFKNEYKVFFIKKLEKKNRFSIKIQKDLN